MSERSGQTRESPSSDATRRVGEGVFVVCLLPILAAVFALALRAPFWADSRPLFLALGVATLAWWMAIALARLGCADLRVVVVGAIALRLIGLIGQPDLSHELQQNVREGRVVARGESPYAFPPATPEGERVHAAPAPLGSWVLGGVVASGGQPGAASEEQAARWVRLFVAFCDLLLLWPLLILLRRRGAPPGLAVAWAWSPLVVMEFAGSGHLDGLALLLLVSALALLVVRGARARRPRARGALGLALLAAATQVKPLALCLLPYVVRGRGAWKRLVLFALLFALPLVPLWFLRGGWSGLGRWIESIVSEPAHGGLVYPPVEWVLSKLFPRDLPLAERIARLGLLALWGMLAIRTFVLRRGPLASSAAVIGAFVVLTPSLEPWTLLWVLPFAALQPRASWLWLVGAAPLLYAPLAANGGHLGLRPGGEWLALAAPFFVLFAYEARVAARGAGAERSARRHMRLRRLRTT